MTLSDARLSLDSPSIYIPLVGKGEYFHAKDKNGILKDTRQERAHIWRE